MAFLKSNTDDFDNKRIPRKFLRMQCFIMTLQCKHLFGLGILYNFFYNFFWGTRYATVTTVSAGSNDSHGKKGARQAQQLSH